LTYLLARFATSTMGASRQLHSKCATFLSRSSSLEHIWSGLRHLTPFEQHPTKPSDTTDALNNYVFTIADMPDGQPKIFIVPIDRVPKAVTELAREIRAYGRD
jgi:hypothetical protein